ncbi:hypothetical protein BU25DRAFT_169829 [Macroventuria anomochaeta]|uniref:Uncharacterized protein n=1 Tax=Macroventuria anomochaeta TaxID=301207 RepID=A0ACB6RPJ9_9PLEO|nr:uncharacterized protein BU25DRAFT_169829 [Macroventuria anomochaeta]KAF2623880.1 hypothetical protein BU25DRAFT_169829 [Macroventuria anomochaeta]
MRLARPWCCCACVVLVTNPSYDVIGWDCARPKDFRRPRKLRSFLTKEPQSLETVQRIFALSAGMDSLWHARWSIRLVCGRTLALSRGSFVSTGRVEYGVWSCILTP